MADNLVITRTLDAPRELVWKVWTDPVHLAKWWGPAGFSVKVARLELRTGGLFHYSQTAPGANAPVWGKFTYDEVTPVEKLVFRSSFSDEAGATQPNPWNPAWPQEIQNTLTLTEQGGRTVLDLRGGPFQASAEAIKVFDENKQNVQKGFQGTFAQLEAYLTEVQESARAIHYHRIFEAPRARVWQAWTSPSIAAWWGPSGFANTIHSMDVRVGGQWNFTMHGPDGTDYPNLVTYSEVIDQQKLAYDHGEPGRPDEFRVTVTFADKGDRTEVNYRMVFPTVEAKQLVVDKFGAVEGLKQNMDRFAHWLEKTGLVVTRVFEAPRAAVWKAFTDPTQLMRWWGPEHFTCPGAKVDLRVGGRYLLGMKGPDGAEFWSTGVYREVVLNQKLVYSDNFSDAQGNVVPASTFGLPGDWPDELIITVTMSELGKGRTLVCIHQKDLPDVWKDMTSAGWSTSLDKLARALVSAS